MPKIKKTEVKPAIEKKEVVEAREKARINAEEKEIAAMKPEERDKHTAMIRRLRTKRASEQKEAKLAELRSAEKTFKVHIKNSKPQLVKAENRKAALKKAGENAFRAFQVSDKYEFPKAETK